MQFTVYLLAFGDTVPIPERIVDVPSDEIPEGTTQDEILERVFFYGQNDFQPKPIRSVSVGDVVKLHDGSLHRVRGAGWESLPAGTDVTTLERGIACSLM